MDPQLFVQNAKEKILQSFSMLKSNMPNEEVYAIFVDVDTLSGQSTIGEISSITKYLNSFLEVVLQSRKNNDKINNLLIFNNTKEVKKTNFCLKAKLGQDKGFALVQVNNVAEMNENTSGQLLVSVNQKINFEENFQLVLHPNDFLFVAIAPLGINEGHSTDSTVSLIFKEKVEYNYLKIIYVLVALLLLIALIYIAYSCIKDDDKKSIKTSPEVKNGFYFY